jgi:hypothetical protein
MPLYKQETVPFEGTITKYQRAELMCLYNTDIPRVECHEQTREIYPDGSIRNTPGEKLVYDVTDPMVMIPLVDPVTYEPTEVMFPAGQFALMAASVYLWRARIRDAEAIAPPPEEPPPETPPEE